MKNKRGIKNYSAFYFFSKKEKNMKIKKILLGDLNYPFYLSQIKNPPSRLYVIGNEEILRERSMAIVGCRECSNYGKKIASTIAYNLGINNIITVSGLAKGIDTFCHKRNFKG